MDDSIFMQTGTPEETKSRVDLVKEILFKLSEIEKYSLIQKVMKISEIRRLMEENLRMDDTDSEHLDDFYSVV
jgi:hypothetical protein